MTAEITRFAQDMDGCMEPYKSGQWVRYEDVQELLKELDEKTKALQFIEGEGLVCDEYEHISQLRSTAGRVLDKYNNI